MNLPLARTLIALSLIAMAFGCSQPDATTQTCQTLTPPRLLKLAPAGNVANERSRGISGTTTFEILVDLMEGGTPYIAEATIINPSGSPTLDQAAIYAVQYSTFAPAKCDGKPVAGKMTLRVTLP